MIILNIVMTIVMLVLVGVVLKLPEYITKSWLEETKNKNAHDIQIESYFKQFRDVNAEVIRARVTCIW